VFYSAPTFDELGRVTTNQYGNGVQNIMSYYANSKRLSNLTTKKSGTTLQNLSYTFTAESDVSSITDGQYTGNASASLSGISYDNLHRLKDTLDCARTSYTFTCSANGNLTRNDELASGASFAYKAHAVTNANGRVYSYDACGNMTNRNTWALSYDEENQLTQIVGTNRSLTAMPTAASDSGNSAAGSTPSSSADL